MYAADHHDFSTAHAESNEAMLQRCARNEQRLRCVFYFSLTLTFMVFLRVEEEEYQEHERHAPTADRPGPRDDGPRGAGDFGGALVCIGLVAAMLLSLCRRAKREQSRRRRSRARPVLPV